MIKSLLLMSFSFFVFTASSQTNNPSLKEARLSAGIGIGGASQNTKTVGRDTWMQLSYTLLERVAIAMEFENTGYKIPGYIKNLPVEPNEITAVDNNFSLLFKYSLPVKSALKVDVASGWSLSIHQSKYYSYEADSVSQHITPYVSSYSDYGIPLLLEIGYPLSKTIDVQVRAKYNLNPENASTYGAAIGLSLKL